MPYNYNARCSLTNDVSRAIVNGSLGLVPQTIRWVPSVGLSSLAGLIAGKSALYAITSVTQQLFESVCTEMFESTRSNWQAQLLGRVIEFVGIPLLSQYVVRLIQVVYNVQFPNRQIQGDLTKKDVFAVYVVTQFANFPMNFARKIIKDANEVPPIGILLYLIALSPVFASRLQ